METFSALLTLCVGNSPVPGEFPHKGQWGGALMFLWINALNKRLSKQSWGWWFDKPSRSLWRHCNECSLNRAVNAGTTDLASSFGINGLVKQTYRTIIATTALVNCLKNWNMIGFVIFTCQVSDLICLFYCDVPLFYIIWKLVVYPVQGTNITLTS